MGENFSTDYMNPNHPIKLALLLCDAIPPALAAKISYESYLDVFQEHLLASYPCFNSEPATSCENRSESMPFILDGLDVVHKQEYPNLEEGEYRGVLVSGSTWSAYDNAPWIIQLVEWIRDVVEKKPHVKLIGVCFGHQIIARALGGECVPNSSGGSEIGTTGVELTELGMKVFRTDKSTLPIQQMHHDHVVSIPPSFHLLGSTQISPMQGLVRFYPSSPLPSASSPTPNIDPRQIQVLTVRGHPEFTSEIINALIDVRHEIGFRLSEEEVKEGRERAGRVHEGRGIIGMTFWRVLSVGGDANAHS